MRTKKRVYVDLDGVMCDFYKAYLAKKSIEGNNTQSLYGFFRNLEPIEDAIESFKLLSEHYDV